jgi:hypothetical protein
MKTCHTCHKTYEDDSMVYCLDDGARLVDADTTRDANATLNLPIGPTIHAGAAHPKGQLTSANPQATITARPEQFRTPYSPGAVSTEVKSQRSSVPWVFAIVLVLGISGVVIAWMLTRGSDDQARRETGRPTPVTSPLSSPEATVETSPSPNTTPRVETTPAEDRVKPTPQPTPEPTRERPKQVFSVLNNMTFNGSRITYYPRPSFGQCQADCSGNASCRGFTWIRPGAYNPGDAAMCYLMSAVTARVPHACCISGVRN